MKRIISRIPVQLECHHRHAVPFVFRTVLSLSATDAILINQVSRVMFVAAGLLLFFCQDRQDTSLLLHLATGLREER